MPPPRRKRSRRSAEEARRLILEAAERHLAEAGPDGIRLQQIAAEVGVSHPAILHHFGSREELLREVVNGALARLEGELLRALTHAGEQDELALADMIERASGVLETQGHGRVVAWLLLSGRAVEPSTTRLRTIAQAAHARRTPGPGAPDFEDTVFRTLLVALALFGEAVAGKQMRRSAGLENDSGAERRFHAWLARFLAEAHESSRD
jgi:AcrR family transcriptional regulator